MHGALLHRLRQLNGRVSGLVELGAQSLGYKRGDLYADCCAPVGARNETVYPTLDICDRPDALNLPDSGKATVEFVVTRRSVDERDNGKKRHGYTLKIKSINPVAEDEKPAKKKLPGSARTLSRLVPRTIRFGRDRNSMGEFAPNDGGGITPEQTHAAYNAPASRPAAKTVGGVAGVAGLAGLAALIRAKRSRPR